MQDKAYCRYCEYFSVSHKEEKACFMFPVMTDKLSAIYDTPQIVKGGNCFILNKDNNCHGFKDIRIKSIKKSIFKRIFK